MATDVAWKWTFLITYGLAVSGAVYAAVHRCAWSCGGTTCCCMHMSSIVAASWTFGYAAGRWCWRIGGIRAFSILVLGAAHMHTRRAA